MTGWLVDTSQLEFGISDAHNRSVTSESWQESGSFRVDPAAQKGRSKLHCVSNEAAFGRLCFLWDIHEWLPTITRNKAMFFCAISPEASWHRKC